MNVKTNNAKVKLCAVADKLQNSKVYKCAEKTAVAVGSAVTALGFAGMSVFAADGGASTLVISEVNASEVLSNAQPFINAGIPILVVVGGIRLGMRFLRSSMH